MVYYKVRLSHEKDKQHAAEYSTQFNGAWHLYMVSGFSVPTSKSNHQLEHRSVIQPACCSGLCHLRKISYFRGRQNINYLTFWEITVFRSSEWKTKHNTTFNKSWFVSLVFCIFIVHVHCSLDAKLQTFLFLRGRYKRQIWYRSWGILI